MIPFLPCFQLGQRGLDFQLDHLDQHYQVGQRGQMGQMGQHLRRFHGHQEYHLVRRDQGRHLIRQSQKYRGYQLDQMGPKFSRANSSQQRKVCLPNIID